MDEGQSHQSPLFSIFLFLTSNGHLHKLAGGHTSQKHVFSPQPLSNV